MAVILTDRERNTLAWELHGRKVDASPSLDPIVVRTEAMVDVINKNGRSILANTRVETLVYALQVHYRRLMSGNSEDTPAILFNQFADDMDDALRAVSSLRGIESWEMKYAQAALNWFQIAVDELVTLGARLSEPHLILWSQCEAISKNFRLLPQVYATAQRHFAPLWEARNSFYESDATEDLMRCVEVNAALFDSPRVDQMLKVIYRESQRGSDAKKEFMKLQKDLELSSLFYGAGLDN